MALEFDDKDKTRIETGLRDRYAKAASGPAGMFRYPVGEDGLRGQGYPEATLRALPQRVRASFCGVGNPFSLGQVQAGEAILDIGSGAGIDALVAAHLTGPTGLVRGVELIPKMLVRAEENRLDCGLNTVSFVQGSAEALPFPDASFDRAVSNGVFNLVLDKARALAEVFRVLRPGGRLCIADQVLVGPPPESAAAAVASWAG